MRMIDADELMEHAWRDKLDSRELIAEMIVKAPTIKEIPTKIPIGIFEKLVSQEPILNKIRTEIVDTLYVDSLIFGELIDFRNGKISADDVIEEFNRVTRLEVLKIIDKYKAESEVEE